VGDGRLRRGDWKSLGGDVSKRLALLTLPEDVQASVHSGGISVGDALELVQLVDHPERLRRAAASVNGIVGAVEAEVRDLEAITRFSELVEEAEKGEVRYVPAGVAENSLPRIYPKGSTRLCPGPGPFTKGLIPLESHAGLGCDAVTVFRYPTHAVAVPICTDPAGHRPPRERRPRVTGRNPAGDRKAELRRAEARRRVHVRNMLAGALDHHEWALAAVDLLAERARPGAVRLAAELLGIDPPAAGDERGALGGFARRGSDQLAMATAALVLADGEASASTSGIGWHRFHGHFARLVASGYVPSEAEVEALGPGWTDRARHAADPGVGPGEGAVA